jgi:hypothetical protein
VVTEGNASEDREEAAEDESTGGAASEVWLGVGSALEVEDPVVVDTEPVGVGVDFPLIFFHPR